MKNFTCHPFLSNKITIHTNVIRIEKNQMEPVDVFTREIQGPYLAKKWGKHQFLWKDEKIVIFRWFLCMRYTNKCLNKMIIAGGEGQTRPSISFFAHSWFLFGITNILNSHHSEWYYPPSFRVAVYCQRSPNSIYHRWWIKFDHVSQFLMAQNP